MKVKVEVSGLQEKEFGCCAMKPKGCPPPVLVFSSEDEYRKSREAAKGPGREYWKKRAGSIRLVENYVPKKK